MAKRKGERPPTLTEQTRRVAVAGQTLVFLFGASGIICGILIAFEEPAPGFAIALGALLWALPVYAVMMFIEWRVTRPSGSPPPGPPAQP